jgi:hypothetical protein
MPSPAWKRQGSIQPQQTAGSSRVERTGTNHPDVADTKASAKGSTSPQTTTRPLRNYPCTVVSPEGRGKNLKRDALPETDLTAASSPWPPHMPVRAALSKRERSSSMELPQTGESEEGKEKGRQRQRITLRTKGKTQQNTTGTNAEAEETQSKQSPVGEQKPPDPVVLFAERGGHKKLSWAAPT